jgi:uncharacterized protein involved in response to NO
MINTVEITARPVTLREVTNAVRMGKWSDRRILLLHPWPTNADNIRMWFLIGLVVIMGVSLVVRSNRTDVPFIITAIALSVFSIAVMYVFQVTSGLSERLALRARAMQAALYEQMQNSISLYGTEVVEELKQATGREQLKSDPISVAAAVIELTKKSRVVPSRNNNPFRALLDGTLHPRDIDNSTENDDDDDFLGY